MFYDRLLGAFKITEMILSIDARELTEQKGTFIATVDWHKWDGGEVGTPGAVKYGDTKEDAYNKLKQLLEERGHEECE